MSTQAKPEKTPEQKRQETTGAVVVLVLLAVIAGPLYFGQACSRDRDRDDSGDRTQSEFKNPSTKDLDFYVRYAAQAILKDRLKAPSTASFVSQSVAWHSGDRWLVALSVDAENSFGARIRSNYLVALRVDPSDASQYFHSPSRAVLEIDGKTPTDVELRAARIANQWED